MGEMGSKRMLSVLTISLTKVLHYNPSVSFADSSPYTGEPLTRTASTRVPQNDTERGREETITDQGRHDLGPGPARADEFNRLLHMERYRVGQA